MSPSRYQVSVTRPADNDIVQILAWSEAEFGLAATDRYETLIQQALIDLGEDPQRPGAQSRDEIREGIYIYHLSFSRRRVRGRTVKEPRHFILYKQGPDHVIEVLRILHDSRDLARHLPA
ncbi:MAG TPA: type II toxin-antitoxin system RelE/ParE family toxin [Acidisarcina sp.]